MSTNKAMKYNIIHTYIISSVHNSVVQQLDMKLVREKHYIQAKQDNTIQNNKYQSYNLQYNIVQSIITK